MSTNSSKCLLCGKPRYKWSKRRRKEWAARYCSNKCRDAAPRQQRVPIEHRLWKKVMKRDKWLCRYCGANAEEVDHVIPTSKGGSTDGRNLVASCMLCNRILHDRLFESFEAKREWILKKRGIKFVEGKKVIKGRKRIKEWWAWVYGGMKRKP